MTRSPSWVRLGSATAAVASVLLVLFLVAPSAALGEAGGSNNGGSTAATESTTGSSQVPNNSNGVNHNDPPPPANSDCTNSAGTSGTCSSPQPWSTADQNNTGANNTSGSNAYASTRNGAAADNGGNNGRATGRPCAGCVGKADNKNPSGQAPNGPTDHNNGYECDGNNGIGQTNPAHTGCAGTASSAPTSTQGVAEGHGPSASTGSGSGSSSSGSAGSTATCEKPMADSAAQCVTGAGATVAPAGIVGAVAASPDMVCAGVGTMLTQTAVAAWCPSVESDALASERSRLASAGFPDNAELGAAGVAAPESQVLGAASAVQPAHVSGELAFTGGGIARYLLLAAALLLGGLAIRWSARRRRPLSLR